MHTNPSLPEDVSGALSQVVAPEERLVGAAATQQGWRGASNDLLSEWGISQPDSWSTELVERSLSQESLERSGSSRLSRSSSAASATRAARRTPS